MSVIRQRTKNLIYAGLVGVLGTALIASSIGIYTYNQYAKEKKIIRAEYEEKLKAAEEIKQEQLKQKKHVLLANKEIKAGETLKEDSFIISNLPVDQVPENIISNPDQLNGKITKIDIAKNASVLPSMLFENGVTPKDLRNQEFTYVSLPSKLKKDDFVDVRINFPTGQDYIILGKKKVKDLLTGTVWFEMNEQEILAMSSATVDGYINGAKIYALTYVDPYMQEAPVPNYPVNSDVLSLILIDPNILNMAKEQLKVSAREKLNKALEEMSAEQKQRIAAAQSVQSQSVKIAGNATIQGNTGSPTQGTNSSNGISTNSAVQPTTDVPDPLPQPAASTATTEQKKKENDIYKEAVESSVQQQP